MTETQFESQNYPYRKWDVLPKVEGVKAIPTDEKSKRHILYQTTSQAYGQITPTKFELPVQRHPLHQTISKYQGSALGHRSGMLNNSKSPNPLGEDGNESFLTNDSGFETPSSTPGDVGSSQTKSHPVEIHLPDSHVDLDFNDGSCHSIVSNTSSENAQIGFDCPQPKNNYLTQRFTFEHLGIILCQCVKVKFKELLQVNMSKILQIDIVLADLLAGYYRYSNANNNDKTLLQVLEAYWQSPQDVESIQTKNSLYPYNESQHLFANSCGVQPSTPKKTKPKNDKPVTPRKWLREFN